MCPDASTSRFTQLRCCWQRFSQYPGREKKKALVSASTGSAKCCNLGENKTRFGYCEPEWGRRPAPCLLLPGSLVQCITSELDVFHSRTPRVSSNLHMAIKEVATETARGGKASQDYGLWTSNYSMETPASPTCALSMFQKYSFLLPKTVTETQLFHWSCCCCWFGWTCSSSPGAHSFARSLTRSACFSVRLSSAHLRGAFFTVTHINCCANLRHVDSSWSE